MIQDKLQKCCKLPYKLVIVDLNMPKLDGIGMMEQLQQYDLMKDTVFIMASC